MSGLERLHLGFRKGRNLCRYCGGRLLEVVTWNEGIDNLAFDGRLSVGNRLGLVKQFRRGGGSFEMDRTDIVGLLMRR